MLSGSIVLNVVQGWNGIMSEELKPVRCGCGGFADSHLGKYANWFISCEKCGVRTPLCDSRDEAIMTWNRAMGATDTNVGDKIIYCKDCKYSHMTIDGLCKYCDIWFPNEEMYEDGKHFCASAEKRML